MTENPTLNKIYATGDVNAQLKIYNEIFLKCLGLCAPLVTQEERRQHFYTIEI